ncbi:hypothetical protein GF406_16450, partial [candidate division KSB1 bacterium]|nr:hypothetical protein [candidate division KSB1 bacterium]
MRSFNALIKKVSIYSLLIYGIVFSGDKEIRNKNVSSPDVASFELNMNSSVNNKGDLNLDIPLVSLPARGNLKFDLTLNYNSSVKLDQPASWVGLGWSLDIGTISRIPQGNIFTNSNTDDVHPQVDFARAVTGTTGDIVSQPDIYNMSLNGQTYELMMNTSESTISNFPFSPFASSISDENPNLSWSNISWMNCNFIPFPWQPFKFVIRTGSTSIDGYSPDMEDIQKILVFGPDGTRYVFGQPLLGEAEFPSTSGSWSKHRFIQNWKLTAILAPNFNYNFNAFDNSNYDSENGGWIKITYRTWDDTLENNQETEQNAKTLDTITKSSPDLFKQVTFPYRIESPTHFIEFVTKKRFDRDLAWKQYHDTDPLTTSMYVCFERLLEKIVLYKKGNASLSIPDKIIKEIIFDYEDNGATSRTSYSSYPEKLQKMLSKLTLTNISIKGYKNQDSFQLPKFNFTYNDTDLSWYEIDEDINTYPVVDYQNEFGYFDSAPLSWGINSDQESNFWLLKEIEYPEGGKLSVQYESDSLHSLNMTTKLFVHNNLDYTTSSNTFSENKTGGARVTQIIKDSRIHQEGPDTLLYSYGTGRTSGIPETYYRKQISDVTVPYYYSGMRGQFNVLYDRVTEQRPDGSKVHRYYHSNQNTQPDEEQLTYKSGRGHLALISGNSTWSKHLLDSTVVFDKNNQRRSSEHYHYTTWGDQSGTSIELNTLIPSFSTGGGSTPAIKQNFAASLLDSVIKKEFTSSGTKISGERFTYNDDGILPDEREIFFDNGANRVLYKKETTTFSHLTRATATENLMLRRNFRKNIKQRKLYDKNDNCHSSKAHVFQSVGSSPYT